jgi:hypothetical protein
LGLGTAAAGGGGTGLPGGRLHAIGRAPRSSIAEGTGSFPDARPRYHNREQVVCADCHTTHASQAHEHQLGAPRPGEQVPYAGPPSTHLLKAADPLDLCLACHDGRSFAPDVVGSDANGLARRSAGFFDEPETPNPRGHDLGRGLAGGSELCTRCHFSSGDQMKVTCVDCHDPHGNDVARNLRWASWPEGTPDLGLLVDPSATGMARYEYARVAYGTLNSNALLEPSSMCFDCHHVFSGSWNVDPDGTGIHNRHPAYDSEHGSPNNIAQGQADGGSAPAHWQGGTGSGFLTTPRLRFVRSGASDFATARGVDPNTNGVFCMTCHQAHGSDQAFGATFTVAGGYRAAGCDQCHLIAAVDLAPVTSDVPTW